MPKKTLEINGPFFTNYSYARVNRGLAIALKKIQSDYDVSVYASKETIDYFPSVSDLEKKPELKGLFKENNHNDVVIYNNFPKSPTDLHGLKELKGIVKLGYIAWEESIYPKIWVDEINENLHGVMTISSFTKEILEKSGVKIPIRTVPIAIDNELMGKPTATYPLSTKKKFKFLHISTAKKRKGVDLLLKAYFETFTKNDDVVLIIKTTPNPDNIVEKLIEELKSDNSPEVEVINSSDLSDESLRNLHGMASCEVYPSRAEGFGLPILEAMYQGIPVITTGYSGQMDFCNEQNSYLIDYKIEYTKDSELVNLGAQWAEPSLDHLKLLLKEVYTEIESEKLKLKVSKARVVAQTYTWENSAKLVMDFIRSIENISSIKNLNAAVITPFNDETGIAEYSKYLYKPIEGSFENFYYIANKDISDRTDQDDKNVVRLWEVGETDFTKTLDFVKNENIKIVHIQYHSGSFFSTDALGDLIKNLKELGILVFITFHAFRSTNFDYLKDVENLNLADKIFIHNPNDFEYAKAKLDNVEYFILPTRKFPKRDKYLLRKKLGIDEKSVLIASHGLLNTNKNIPEIIEALSLVRKTHDTAKFISVNAVSSNNIHSTGIFDHCKDLVDKLNLKSDVVFVPQFLDEEYIEIFLQIADIIIFNYTEVGESASASVRKALASSNAVIVTDINMFAELNSEVLKIKDSTPQSVANAVCEIIENKKLSNNLVLSAQDFIEENLYEKKALDTLEFYTESL